MRRKKLEKRQGRKRLRSRDRRRDRIARRRTGRRGPSASRVDVQSSRVATAPERATVAPKIRGGSFAGAALEIVAGEEGWMDSDLYDGPIGDVYDAVDKIPGVDLPDRPRDEEQEDEEQEEDDDRKGLLVLGGLALLILGAVTMGARK